MSDKRNDKVPDAPPIPEVAPKHSEALSAFSDIYALERSYAVPPETPEARVKFLRNLLTKVFKNEKFQSELEQAGRSVNPLPGKEVDRRMQKLSKVAKDDIIPVLKQGPNT